jgi:hypothetical protein
MDFATSHVLRIDNDVCLIPEEADLLMITIGDTSFIPVKPRETKRNVVVTQ